MDNFLYIIQISLIQFQRRVFLGMAEKERSISILEIMMTINHPKDKVLIQQLKSLRKN